MPGEFRRVRFNSGVSWLTALASLIGVTGFLYPFVLPAISHADDRGAHAADAPYLFALVTVLCVVAIAVELDRGETGGVRRSASKRLGRPSIIDPMKRSSWLRRARTVPGFPIF